MIKTLKTKLEDHKANAKTQLEKFFEQLKYKLQNGIYFILFTSFYINKIYNKNKINLTKIKL